MEIVTNRSEEKNDDRTYAGFIAVNSSEESSNIQCSFFQHESNTLNNLLLSSEGNSGRSIRHAISLWIKSMSMRSVQNLSANK
jgi:hypothetical protein